MSGPTSASSYPVEPDFDASAVAEIKSLLVKGAKERAKVQYEGLVARHQHRISRIAFRYLKNEADVDEAVQDTFLKAFLHLPSHEEKVPFIAWLIRIAINSCLDRLKAKSRRSRWMLPLIDSNGNERTGIAELVTRNQNPEEELLSKEQRTRLDTIIRRLPERQQAVLMLSVFESATTQEISAIMGVSEATVRVHQFRAIRRLQKWIRREHW
jgi:RNA polymerase sigma-70 factor (ECF subfamily)